MHKIIWLTGNTEAGKTTLAKAMKEKLFNYTILDGDEMRDSISIGAGFSKEAREEHNLRVARLAKVLQAQGQNVIVAVIAPFQSTRDKINEIIDCDWVYIRGGKVGEQYPYEIPANPNSIVDGSFKTMIVEEEVIKVVEDLRLFNVFVFGLPRSGTSMMTRIVELLGVKVIYTSENDERRQELNEKYKKKLGDYHPNEKGFFEITENMLNNYIKILATPYSGCKMIIPVAPRNHRFKAVKFNSCAKVIQMWRDPEEIRQSQQAFYRGNAVEDAEGRIAYLRSCLVQQQLWFQQHRVSSLDIEYRDVLANPRAIVEKVAKHINAVNDIEAAVNSVDSKLTRFKKEELEAGI